MAEKIRTADGQLRLSKPYLGRQYDAPPKPRPLVEPERSLPRNRQERRAARASESSK